MIIMKKKLSFFRKECKLSLANCDKPTYNSNHIVTRSKTPSRQLALPPEGVSLFGGGYDYLAGT